VIIAMVQQGQQGQQAQQTQQVQQGGQQNQQVGQSMPNGQGMQFADKDILQVTLNATKHTAQALNVFILEASNEQLRRDYMTVLGDVYNQQKQVFDLMEQKGYYSVQDASTEQITQAQNKFNSQVQ